MLYCRVCQATHEWMCVSGQRVKVMGSRGKQGALEKKEKELPVHVLYREILNMHPAAARGTRHVQCQARTLICLRDTCTYMLP